MDTKLSLYQSRYNKMNIGAEEIKVVTHLGHKGSFRSVLSYLCIIAYHFLLFMAHPIPALLSDQAGACNLTELD